MTKNNMTTAEFDRIFLLTLNDDCIYEILDQLSLNDICVSSRTCKRLQELCGNHFRRKYPNKVNDKVRITILSDGRLRVLPFGNYVKYFNNFVKNITITNKYNFQQRKSKNKQSKIASIVNFFKAKCDSKLYKISITGEMNTEWVSICEKVENILCNVEIVQFGLRRQQGHVEAKFLKYCRNVRRLILREVSDKSNIDAILQQQYQQLTHFFYKGRLITINAEKLKTFFQMNSKVQCVAWEFHCSDINDNMAIDHAVQCIQAHDYALNLEHLLLLVEGPINDKFHLIYRQLRVLCDRDRFKTLELKFTYILIHPDTRSALISQAHQLAKLKQLTKIHLKHLALTDVIPALQSLSHLKIIVINDMFFENNWNSWSDFEELKTLVDSTQDLALTQIEEVQIEDIDLDRHKLFTFFVMLFARHWVNLEKILVPTDVRQNYDFTFPIDELNRAREKLSNARELTIFTNHKGITTNLNDGLVKLKLMEFERCSDSQPFQNYCMKV